MDPTDPVLDALIVAIPETAGSALYGMIDVLSSAGHLWQELAGTQPQRHLIRTRIVSPAIAPFACGNRIPVQPDVSIDEDPQADIVILPELWLAPDDDLKGHYPALLEWVRQRYRAVALSTPPAPAPSCWRRLGFSKTRTPLRTGAIRICSGTAFRR